MLDAVLMARYEVESYKPTPEMARLAYQRTEGIVNGYSRLTWFSRGLWTANEIAKAAYLQGVQDTADALSKRKSKE